MDVVSLVIGTAGLITVAQGCLQAARVIDGIKEFKEETAPLYAEYNFEQVRLTLWMSQVLGVKYSPVQLDTLHIGENQLPSMLTSDSPINPHLPLQNALVEVRTILGKLNEELQKYGARINETGTAARSGVSLRRRATFQTKIYKEGGKDEIQKLLKRFKEWNDRLDGIVDSRMRHILISNMHTQLLLAAQSSQDLRLIQQVAQVNHPSLSNDASFRLDLRSLEEQPNRPSGLRVLASSITPYTIPDSRDGNLRRIGRLRTSDASRPDIPVLQEWKLGQTNWGEDEIREAETRADRLASMLRLDKKPVKLRCLDLVAYSIADGGGGDHKRLDFCFLYRYPPSASSTVEPLTLKQVMLLSEARKPTLSQRFRIATMLAESILELHSSKWLHKAVCSSNVLFFSDAQSGHVDFSTPHIAGFEFSRPDTVEDQTLDQFQGLCFDIYCHPDLVRVLEGREASNRPRYQRQYDIYGLGVILLEVGCWMPLKKQIDLTRAKMGRSRHEEIMIMLATLPSRMGNKYRDVVHSCLTWGSDAEKNSTEGGNNRTGNIETFNEGWKNQVEEFGYKIVHVLRECHCQM